MKVVSRDELAKTKLAMHKSFFNVNLAPVYYGCAAVVSSLMIYLIYKVCRHLRKMYQLENSEYDNLETTSNSEVTNGEEEILTVQKFPSYNEPSSVGKYRSNSLQQTYMTSQKESDKKEIGGSKTSVKDSNLDASTKKENKFKKIGRFSKSKSRPSVMNIQWENNDTQ